MLDKGCSHISIDDIRDQKLVELYHRYIGEPESKRDVYGYWLLLLGSVTGLIGVFVFQIEQLFFAGSFEIREIAIVLSAIGLALGLFAVVVLLPVRRRGTQASVLGLAIAFLSIFVFTQVYPGAWSVGPAYSAEIIGLYTLGIGILVAVAILVPIVTGEKGLLVEPELGLGSDEAPILVGDATRDAFFTVYETPTNDWSWRTIKRDAIGQAATTVATDTDARMEVETVREKIAGAGLLDITTAAFRLYRTAEGAWEWSLVTAEGSIVAASDGSYGDRDGIESAVNFLKEETPDASRLEIQGAAYDVSRGEGDRWHWRLIDERHRPLAAGPDDYGEESAAEDSLERFVEWVDDPRVLAVETVAIELLSDGDQWRWRVVDSEDDMLLTSDATFDSRGDAETAATVVADHLLEAAVIEHGSPGFEVYETDGWSDAGAESESAGAGWTWRLRDRADELIATMHGRSIDEADATASAERTRSVLEATETIEFEGADYEVYPAEGEWHWRLIDEDGAVMADSGESYEDKSEVMEGMRTLKENAPDAEVLEIETAAFEIYLSEDGEYAWRLIDEGGKLIAESAGSYPSRMLARESVEFLIEHVDDAAVRAMEHATFQLTSDEETWGFWLVDTDGTILAESVEDYPTYDDVTTAIANVREAGADATIDTMREVTVQIRQNAGYHWRLVDADTANLAVSPQPYESYEGLIDEDETVRAVSAGSYESRDAVDDAIEAARKTTETASILEIDEVSFEFAQRDDGWIWRLIDENGAAIAESVEAHDTRQSAREEMLTVKEHAPEGETVVSW